MCIRDSGKGLIQDVSALPFDGAALKVTVGRYYTPSGRCLQALEYGRGATSRADAPAADRPAPQTQKASAKEAFTTLRTKRSIESGGGVSPDLVVEADLGLYDYAALVPVVTGGGGCMTDWNGDELTIPHHEASKGRVVAAANGALHAAAIEVLRAA